MCILTSAPCLRQRRRSCCVRRMRFYHELKFADISRVSAAVRLELEISLIDLDIHEYFIRPVCTYLLFFNGRYIEGLQPDSVDLSAMLQPRPQRAAYTASIEYRFASFTLWPWPFSPAVRRIAYAFMACGQPGRHIPVVVIGRRGASGGMRRGQLTRRLLRLEGLLQQRRGLVSIAEGSRGWCRYVRDRDRLWATRSARFGSLIRGRGR